LGPHILLVKHVNLAVLTPRPDHDLFLISLKHDDRRVSKSGTADSCVGVISYTLEVSMHDVICDGVRPRAGVLSEVRCVGDCKWMLESSWYDKKR